MSELPAAERELLAGADRRIGTAILVLIPLGTGVAAWQGGARMGVAFAAGGVLAYLNYRWIAAVVDTLVRAQRTTVPRRTYLKLFLPLALLAAGLYVIFARSLLPVVGFLGGLFLLVAGVLFEAVYQLTLSVRK